MKTNILPEHAVALSGEAILNRHFVHGHPIAGEFPDFQQIIFGMGCFWGAERKFWSLPGVFTTAVGYTAGITKHPTYQQVCSGQTGHAEVVLVVYDETMVDIGALLQVFWQNHDPTQGMRQGNDHGTQYRSGIYVRSSAQLSAAERSRDLYQERLQAAGFGAITTEIIMAASFYYAENYHQQYLAKNPDGYCGLGGTGVSCPLSFSA